MSVRMALAKLSAFAAGGAIIGGGAVHVAEAPASQVQYVKHAKPAKRVAVAKPAKRKIARVAAAQPKMRKIRRVITKSYSCEAPAPQMAMAVPYMPQLPPQPMPESGGGGQTIVVGGSGGMGFGGGFFGGFFGGSGSSSGGSVVVTSTTTGSTSTSGGSTSTSGGSTSTSSGAVESQRLRSAGAKPGGGSNFRSRRVRFCETFWAHSRMASARPR